MVEKMTDDHGAVVEQWRDANAVVEEILASVKPIVSAINGVAVGAGLAVALLADVSIIAESARLSDGHARLGVAAGDHAALIWPLLCGMAKAKYYLIDRRLRHRSGGRAHRAGDQVCGRRRCAHRGPGCRRAPGPQSRTAVQWTKRALNQWLKAASPAFGESLALEMLAIPRARCQRRAGGRCRERGLPGSRRPAHRTERQPGGGPVVRKR